MLIGNPYPSALVAITPTGCPTQGPAPNTTFTLADQNYEQKPEFENQDCKAPLPRFWRVIERHFKVIIVETGFGVPDRNHISGDWKCEIERFF